MAALPVREHVTGEVAPLLARLAAEEASGVLARESGALHLVRGRVVYAESVSAPGPQALLKTHDNLELLVEEGRLPRGAAELALLGALFDAAYFTLTPADAPARFRYDDTGHDPEVTVDAALLERETLRRRALLHRAWPDARTDDAPLHRTGSRPPPPWLPARRRAVLAEIDGERTATAIAHRLGRRTYPTLLDVRRLTAAGLVTARQPPGPTALPVKDVPADDPQLTLLKRLRDALEAL
ncbi:transcriptional regulator [Streptomyces sp. 4F14]|uniref:transcriptional regulator n=1 Tax=Streptomyces sp. 4F14 TaxID=3394380 RepID=UPI003A858DCB